MTASKSQPILRQTKGSRSGLKFPLRVKELYVLRPFIWHRITPRYVDIILPEGFQSLPQDSRVRYNSRLDLLAKKSRTIHYGAVSGHTDRLTCPSLATANRKLKTIDNSLQQILNSIESEICGILQV